MKRTGSVWRLVGLAGALASVMLIAGFVYAAVTLTHPAAAEPPDQPVTKAPSASSAPGEGKAKGIHILALGDSLTRGVGDEKGEGYVGKVKNLLQKESDKDVYVWNMAVNGARTADLLEELKDPSILADAEQADLILLTIGGNDLNGWAMAGQNANALMAASSSRTSSASSSQDADSLTESAANDLQIDYEKVRQHLPEAVERLKQILSILEQHAPKAKIVYVGLYHPYPDFDPQRVGGSVIQQWNYEAAKLANAYSNVAVVPTFDFFQTKWSEYLFTDHFHPNGTGYTEIAARVMQVIR